MSYPQQIELVSNRASEYSSTSLFSVIRYGPFVRSAFHYSAYGYGHKQRRGTVLASTCGVPFFSRVQCLHKNDGYTVTSLLRSFPLNSSVRSSRRRKAERGPWPGSSRGPSE